LKSSANTPNQELLRLHLEYHAKTRTIAACIGLFLDCFAELSKASPDSTVADARRVYFLGSSGALFTLNREEELRRAVKAFVTFAQLPEVVRLLCESLHIAWQLVEMECTKGVQSTDEPPAERKRKRAKVDPFTGETESPIATWAAVSFALLARMASIALPALPIHLLDASSMGRLRDSIHKCWKLVIRPAIGLTGDVATANSWPGQLVSSAALKLHHALSHSVYLSNLPVTEELSTHIQKVLTMHDSVQPELLVECVSLT
jgi:hypothetical protein